MVARALASATVSFGLVSIPVKLYSAAEHSAEVHFNMLHAKDGSRLKQQYICQKEEVVVPRDEIVKGYEFAKDQYVVFTPEELKALEETATKTIEIAEFVTAEKVDPIFFEGAYYLGPDKGGARPYQLLAEAMRRTGRSALATWAARGKAYLVLIRATDEGLVMQQLLYADEVRSFSEVPMETAQVKEAELKLAIQLVEQIASDEFHPEKYSDTVKQRVLELIQRKVEGEEVTTAVTEEPRAQIIDLMEALKASLGGAKPEPAPAAKRAADGGDGESGDGRGGARGKGEDQPRKPARRSARAEEAGEEKRGGTRRTGTRGSSK
jgi:DNA end-binding protein Ku